VESIWVGGLVWGLGVCSGMEGGGSCPSSRSTNTHPISNNSLPPTTQPPPTKPHQHRIPVAVLHVLHVRPRVEHPPDPVPYKVPRHAELAALRHLHHGLPDGLHGDVRAADLSAVWRVRSVGWGRVVFGGCGRLGGGHQVTGGVLMSVLMRTACRLYLFDC